MNANNENKHLYNLVYIYIHIYKYILSFINLHIYIIKYIIININNKYIFSCVALKELIADETFLDKVSTKCVFFILFGRTK